MVSSRPNDADAGGVEEGICHGWGAHRHDNDNGIGCSMRGSEKNAQHTFQQPLPPRLARRKRSTKKHVFFHLRQAIQYDKKESCLLFQLMKTKSV